MSKAAKIAYRPFGLLSGIVGGLVASSGGAKAFERWTGEWPGN